MIFEIVCANFVSWFSALCLEEFVLKVCGCYLVSFPCCASPIDQYHVLKYVCIELCGPIVGTSNSTSSFGC